MEGIEIIWLLRKVSSAGLWLRSLLIIETLLLSFYWVICWKLMSAFSTLSICIISYGRTQGLGRRCLLIRHLWIRRIVMRFRGLGCWCSRGIMKSQFCSIMWIRRRGVVILGRLLGWVLVRIRRVILMMSRGLWWVLVGWIMLWECSKGVWLSLRIALRLRM